MFTYLKAMFLPTPLRAFVVGFVVGALCTAALLLV